MRASLGLESRGVSSRCNCPEPARRPHRVPEPQLLHLSRSLDCTVWDVYGFMFCDLSTHPWRSSFLVHKLKLTIASGQQDCRLCKQKRTCIHQNKQALAPGAKARWTMAHSRNLQAGWARSRHFASRDTRCRGDFHQNLCKEISRADILWQWKLNLNTHIRLNDIIVPEPLTAQTTAFYMGPHRGVEDS